MKGYLVFFGVIAIGLGVSLASQIAKLDPLYILAAIAFAFSVWGFGVAFGFEIAPKRPQ